MCVKSLGSVTDSFKVASNAMVASLESVLEPRLRSIVGEAVGNEGNACTFITLTLTLASHDSPSLAVIVRLFLGRKKSGAPKYIRADDASRSPGLLLQ
jgi:hypothetical protein